jgi:predicted NUDIX family NTP pyrophosphohydrolase
MSKSSKTSAGLLMYRIRKENLEVLLVHLGGPFWSTKDTGAWFVAKGEVGPGEEPLAAAKREFEEETSLKPQAPFFALGSVKHKSGKTVTAWAFEGDCDPSQLKSNTFTMEWPPKSGRQKEFPEVDRYAFLTIAQAKDKMHEGEFPLLARLQDLLRQNLTSR